MEEQNLVKTLELSDETRREGDHGSYGYRKKNVFTHRFRENKLHVFRTLKKGFFLPQNHQSVTTFALVSKVVQENNAKTILGQPSRRHFRFFRSMYF